MAENQLLTETTSFGLTVRPREQVGANSKFQVKVTLKVFVTAAIRGSRTKYAAVGLAKTIELNLRPFWYH